MYYVIQVKVGKEQKVIDDIKRFMSNASDFDVFSPQRKELRKYKGEYKEVTLRCFPGYLFVETNDIKQLFFDLPKVPEFTKILGREALTYNFVPLNEDEARLVDILYNASSNRTTEISNIEVEPGNKVVILDGPMFGQEAIIKKVDLHKRSIEVEFVMFKKKFTAKVGINIVNKLD